MEYMSSKFGVMFGHPAILNNSTGSDPEMPTMMILTPLSDLSASASSAGEPYRDFSYCLPFVKSTRICEEDNKRYTSSYY